MKHHKIRGNYLLCKIKIYYCAKNMIVIVQKFKTLIKRSTNLVHKLHETAFSEANLYK